MGTAPLFVPDRARPWRLAMGLRPLDPARWLEVDDDREGDLAAKRRLLASAHDRVVATLPGSEPAGADLLTTVTAHLAAHHPHLAVPAPDPGLHPVDAAARLVQEDLCVLEQGGPGRPWVLTAASVCWPSRWSLAAKIGRDLSAIHAPVPGYEARLGAPTAAAFDRLRPERPVWRVNWTLVDDPAMHQPAPPAPRPVDDPGAQLWWRVERQTLRRLTDRPAVTFTIRTSVTPLDELVDRHPEVVAHLRLSLATMPAETVAYKGWVDIAGPLRAWLDARGGSDA